MSVWPKSVLDPILFSELFTGAVPESLPPLAIKTGKIQQLSTLDKLKLLPRPLTFTYDVNGDLETITDYKWTKTFSYTAGVLNTISDTETGKVSTFNYTAGDLTSITISDI